jgi:hypothetical protein
VETALSSDTAGGRTTIRLADGPGDVPADLHDRCAALLGRESFVDVAEILSKQRGAVRADVGAVARCGGEAMSSTMNSPERLLEVKAMVAASNRCAPEELMVCDVSMRPMGDFYVSCFSYRNGWLGPFVVDLGRGTIVRFADAIQIFWESLPDAVRWHPVRHLDGVTGGRGAGSEQGGGSGDHRAGRGPGKRGLLRLAARPTESLQRSVDVLGRARLPLMGCRRCGVWGVAGIGYPALERIDVAPLMAGVDHTVTPSRWAEVREAVRAALADRPATERAGYAFAEDGGALVLPGMEIGPLRVRLLAEPEPITWIAGMVLLMRGDVLEELRAMGFALEAAPVEIVEGPGGASGGSVRLFEVVAHLTGDVVDDRLGVVRPCGDCVEAGCELASAYGVDPEMLEPRVRQEQRLVDVPIRRVRSWYPWLLVSEALGVELVRRMPSALELREACERGEGRDGGRAGGASATNI